jgi:U-box domain
MGQTERGDKAAVSALADAAAKTPETSPITTTTTTGQVVVVDFDDCHHTANIDVEMATATAITTHHVVDDASWKFSESENKQATLSPSFITTPTGASSSATCPVSVVPVRRTEASTVRSLGADIRRLQVPDALYDPVTQRRMVNPVVNVAGDSYDRSTVQLESDDANVDASATFSCLYYPNRALESILKLQSEYEQRLQQQGLDEQEQGAVEMINAGTPTSTDKRSDSNLHNANLEIHTDSSKMFDTTRKGEKTWYYATSSGQDVNDNARQVPCQTHHSQPLLQLPEAFYCPITCDIMVDPWIGPDGNTYDYDAIYEWLEQDDHPNCSPVTREPLTLNQLRPNNALYELIQYEVVHKPPHNRHVSIQKWMNATPCKTRSARPHHPTVPPHPPLASSSSERRGQTDVEDGGHDATAVATTDARQGSSVDAERDDDCCCCCCCSCGSGCSCCHACAGLVILGIVLLIVGAASWQFFIFLFVVFLVAGMMQGICT